MRKTAGYGLMCLAGLVALLALGTAIRDVIEAACMHPSSIGGAGFRFGSFIGIFIRSLILGGVALGLLQWGRALVDPAKYANVVLDADQLRRIYAREGLDRRTFSSVEDDLDYSSMSDAELDSIYRAINKEKVPSRFVALLAAIKARVEEVPQQPAAPYSEPAARSPQG